MLDDKIICGMALGFIIGALVAQSNKNVQKIIEQGKDKVQEVMEQGKQMIKEKL